MKAAQLNSSVSAPVRRFLMEFAAEGREFERLRREEQELRDGISAFFASDRLSRDELHAWGGR